MEVGEHIYPTIRSGKWWYQLYWCLQDQQLDIAIINLRKLLNQGDLIHENIAKVWSGWYSYITLHLFNYIIMLANHVDNFSFKRTKICIHVDILLFFINIEQGKFGVKKVIFVISCNVSALRVVHHVCVIKTEIFAAFIASLNQNKKH